MAESTEEEEDDEYDESGEEEEDGDIFFGDYDQHIDEVLPRIYLGDAEAAADLTLLRRKCITHIIVAAKELQPLFPESFHYHHAPLFDLESEDLLPKLPQCFEFIENALSSSSSSSSSLSASFSSSSSLSRVFVHCKKGVSRSAAIIIAYLMKSSKMSFRDATEQIRAARPSVLPNDGFVFQLRQFEQMGCQIHTSSPQYAEYEMRRKENEAEMGHSSILQMLLMMTASANGDGV